MNVQVYQKLLNKKMKCINLTKPVNTTKNGKKES